MKKRPSAPYIGAAPAPYRHIQRWITIACYLIVAGLLAACTEKAERSSGMWPGRDKTLRYDVNAPFTALHPFATSASGSTNIHPLLYSYLFVPNPQGELAPDLAVKWDFAPGTRQWTIHLRTGVKFHNRQPVTARDVKYTLDYYLERKRHFLKSIIDQILTPSDETVILRLKLNDPLILKKIWNIEIVPDKSSYRQEAALPPIGSGPFKFAHRQGTQTVTLEANSAYYGGPPGLDRVIFNYQPDRESAWTRLLSGATDIAQEIVPRNYHIVGQYQDRFHFDFYAAPYYTIMLYNTYDPLFTDPDVRRALGLSIDRDYIVNHILNGFGRIAAGPMGMDTPYHHPEVMPLPFDPVQALKLLHRAGWRPDQNGRLHKEGQPFAFTLLVFKESQIEKRVARFIQLCMNEVGIMVHLQSLEYEKVISRYFQNTQFQSVLTELRNAYQRPGAIQRIWSKGDHGASFAGQFDHPDVNRLIQKISLATDLSERKTLIRKLDKVIDSLQPGTFLFQKTAIDAMSKRINLPAPFSLTHDGIYRLKNASINENFNP